MNESKDLVMDLSDTFYRIMSVDDPSKLPLETVWSLRGMWEALFAANLLHTDKSLLNCVVKGLYCSIAKALDERYDTVERNIRTVIDALWKDDRKNLNIFFEGVLQHKPTPSFFIWLLERRLTLEKKRMLEEYRQFFMDAYKRGEPWATEGIRVDYDDQLHSVKEGKGPSLAELYSDADADKAAEAAVSSAAAAAAVSGPEAEAGEDASKG